MSLFKQITESQHPDRLIDLTLKEIIAAGKVTNPYQTYVLGTVATVVKNAGVGQVYLEGPVTYNSGGTQTEVVNAIKALSDGDAVKLASYLLDCLTVGGTAFAEPTMSVAEWTKLIFARQVSAE